MKKMNLFVCICVIFCMIFSMTAFADEAAVAEETTAVEETAEEIAEEVTEEATEEAAEETSEAAEETAEETAEEVTEEVTEEAAEVTEETTEETAEETEEAVEETEEAAQPKNYDDESAFDRLRAYEIMQGDENGNLNLEDDVTRAEMAQFIINANNMKKIEYTVPADEELFTDVPAEHWAYNTIYLAKSLGIINGHGDGTFEPEGKVTYEQAVKMIVSLLGYTPEAEAKGGYPNGFIAVAAEIGLTQYVEFDQTANAIRKDIAIMLDTALDIPVMVQIAYGSQPEYQILNGENESELVTLEKDFLPAEEVTEEVTEETTEEVTEETTEETAEEVTEETTEETAEEVTEEATEEAAEETTEEAVEEATEE